MRDRIAVMMVVHGMTCRVRGCTAAAVAASFSSAGAPWDFFARRRMRLDYGVVVQGWMDGLLVPGFLSRGLREGEFMIYDRVVLLLLLVLLLPSASAFTKLTIEMYADGTSWNRQQAAGRKKKIDLSASKQATTTSNSLDAKKMKNIFPWSKSCK